MVDGFLVVDKPSGITSHDVVARVRRVFGMKQVGHTGTLDPFATGVLPVALGSATKAIPFLDESVKEYQGVMLLGAATDTQDGTGTIVATGDWSRVTVATIAEVCSRFVGTIPQLPPMYSAIKRDGVPLYRLARKGETVARQERHITIHSLVIDEVTLPQVVFTVRCSKGTYVRTLVDDIGTALGCGAHLIDLRRTASGEFTLAAAVPFATLTATDDLAIRQFLIPPAHALSQLPSVGLTADGCLRVRHGMAPMAADLLAAGDVPDAGRCLLLCGERLVAVAERVGDRDSAALSLRLLRVFGQDCPLHSGK